MFFHHTLRDSSRRNALVFTDGPFMANFIGFAQDVLNIRFLGSSVADLFCRCASAIDR